MLFWQESLKFCHFLAEELSANWQFTNRKTWPKQDIILIVHYDLLILQKKSRMATNKNVPEL